MWQRADSVRLKEFCFDFNRLRRTFATIFVVVSFVHHSMLDLLLLLIYFQSPSFTLACYNCSLSSSSSFCCLLLVSVSSSACSSLLGSLISASLAAKLVLMTASRMHPEFDPFTTHSKPFLMWFHPTSDKVIWPDMVRARKFSTN